MSRHLPRWGWSRKRQKEELRSRKSGPRSGCHHAALFFNQEIVAVALWATRTLPAGKRLHCLRELFHHAALFCRTFSGKQEPRKGISEKEGKAARVATEFQLRNLSPERVVAKKSVPFIDLTSMAHVVLINAALLDVEFVQHTVIAHSQFEFGPALESLVREISELRSHLVDFSAGQHPDVHRKRIKCFRKCRRPNLKGGSHDLFQLACRVLPGRNLAAGLV
jgi:hypothetical protein